MMRIRRTKQRFGIADGTHQCTNAPCFIVDGKAISYTNTMLNAFLPNSVLRRSCIYVPSRPGTQNKTLVMQAISVAVAYGLSIAANLKSLLPARPALTYLQVLSLGVVVAMYFSPLR